MNYIMKHQLGIVLSIFAAVFLSGCVTTVNQYRGGVEPANVSKKSYQIGQVYRVSVGNNFLKRQEYSGYYTSNELVASNDFVISGGLMSTAFTFNGREGEVFRIIAQNDKGNPMIAIPGTRFMMGVGAGATWDQTVASPNAMRSPIGSGGQYALSPKDTRFEKSTHFRWRKGTPYINHELVFTGFSSSDINVLYREYTPDDLIKASFTQAAVYPINARFIDFKDYRIEVLERDGNSIKYRVVKD